ncbi:MAG TPA: hypothetical protein VHL11_25330 [Phototrophicaceae bacterium]|nr:hypothetical protein [Phototrophicaceae bacterium]
MGTPGWSKDGQLIAFAAAVSSTEIAEVIYITDPSGATLHRLTSEPVIETSPAWRPQPQVNAP